MTHRIIIAALLALLPTLLCGCDGEPTQAPNAAPQADSTPVGDATETLSDDTVIALVNGDPIYERNVQETAEPVLLRLGLRPGSEAWEQALEARRANFLDTLIADRLIVQHARKADIALPNEPELIDAAVAEFRVTFASDEAYRQALLDREMSEDDLRRDFADQMRRAEFLRRRSEEKHWQVQPEEVIAYFHQNPEFFEHRVHLQVVFVAAPVDASPEVREEKRGRAELAKAQLESGADFATVARQFSDDPAAAETGGDMGFLRPDEVNPDIQGVVAGMEPGTTVGPVESPSGFYLVRLVKRGQTLQDGPLFEQLKAELEERSRATNIADWLDRIKRSPTTKIEVTSPHYRRYFPAMEVVR